MPRTARHRGASLHKRGLGREQICIMTGVSDSDTAFAILSGRGVISKQRAIEALDGRILHGAHVMADTAAAYPGALEALGVLLQCLFDRFGSVFPQCGLMVFPGVVIVSR